MQDGYFWADIASAYAVDVNVTTLDGCCALCIAAPQCTRYQVTPLGCSLFNDANSTSPFPSTQQAAVGLGAQPPLHAGARAYSQQTPARTSSTPPDPPLTLLPRSRTAAIAAVATVSIPAAVSAAALSQPTLSQPQPAAAVTPAQPAVSLPAA